MSPIFVKSLSLLSAFIVFFLIPINPANAVTVTHLYDKAGRLTKSYYSNGMAITWGYDASGNITSRQIATSAQPGTDIWTGAAGDAQWNNPINWQAQLPTRNLDVVISPGITVNITGASAESKNLTIEADSLLRVESPLSVYGVLTIKGQLITEAVLTIR